MTFSRLRVVSVSGAFVVALALAIPGLAASGGGSGGGRVTDAGSQAAELMTSMSQRDAMRTAPTGQVAAGGYDAAWSAYSSLAPSARSWSQVTNVPYNADAPNYRDPNASNSSGGAGYVTGRIEAVAVDGNCIFAGAGMGGVSRSCDGGTSWTPISDQLSTQSVGNLAVNPADGSLWLATGDGNTGGSTYVGSGIYRLANPDTTAFTSGDKVGGTELDSQIVRKLLIDPNGTVFVAGSRGLYTHSSNPANKSLPWSRVLAPCASGGGCLDVNKNYRDIANDVAVQPGTQGKVIIANLAWRNGASYNGFYLSVNAGASWSKINPLGAINPKDVGNATMAYSADGSKLYVMMESPAALLSGDASMLAGIYVSVNGAAVGPYARIANSSVLAQSGSAERKQRIGGGYQPGVQAWYNQFLGVDPANPMHVYAGLEEVYESWDGGATWNTIGRYWNFGFPCWSYLDAQNTCNGNVVHSDQHSVAFSTDGKTVYVGNDGGLYSRTVSTSANSWKSLATTGSLDALQYYSVGVGTDVQPGAPTGSVQIWGGLQDNGVSLLDPINAGKMVSPYGGDGGMMLVDPTNGCHAVGEYVNLTLQLTTTCGVSSGAPNSGSIIPIAPGDPNPRFIAPFSADLTNPNNWVAGGEFVWTDHKAWTTTSGGDWTQAFDTGAGHSITALVSNGGTVWAGWCGGCNPGGAFHRGLATNAPLAGGYGQVALSSAVPLRMITGVNPVPGDSNSAYVVFGGYSRNWTDGPGSDLSGFGHLWKVTLTGGSTAGLLDATWVDVSGNMPDIPSDNLLISGTTVFLGTDLGLVETSLADLQGGSPTWSRDSIPATVVSQIVEGPDHNLYAATYGRGIWKAGPLA